MLSTLWWLVKLGWRSATRVRRAFAPELSTVNGRPPGPNLADFLDSQSPDFQARVRELAETYARTFCGKCGAGPEHPERRCSECVSLLAKVLHELDGDAQHRLVEFAREGKL